MTPSEQSGASINPEPTGNGSVPYPVHRVLSVFHDAAAATAAIQQLGEAGVLLDTVTLFHGDAGAERLTATAQGGTGGWMTRLLRTFGGEQEDIRAYEQAVIGGDYLITTPANADEEKHRARDVLRANGGDRIRYFGPSTVENL